MQTTNITTIEEFVNFDKHDTITYFNMSLLEQLSNETWITIMNVINDYMEEIKNVAVKVTLSWEEQRKYLYKPKLLSYDVYGSTELFFVILLINDMADVKEFSNPSFKMLKKDHMNRLLSYIYNAEKNTIDKY